MLCFVCVDSHSFRVEIALPLFCWILEFVRKVLKFFENFFQPDELVEKPNLPIHWVKISEIAACVVY